MRVLCLNTWGGTLHQPLIDYLAGCDADVICLQEVVHSPDTARPVLTYRDGAHILPQRANLFGELAAALPGHAATFCPAARGVLWDGATAIPSYWGIATFVRRDIPVIGQWQGFIHGNYSHDGYGAHPRSRCAHGVRVFADGIGPMAIAHLHGLRDPGAGKADTPDRHAQAHRIAAMMAALAEPGDLRVLCGDFNVTPDSETFALLGDRGLHDLVTGRGFTDTRTSHYPKPGRFADYMLVSDTAPVQDFQVVAQPEVSDHRPLLLTLSGDTS